MLAEFAEYLESRRAAVTIFVKKTTIFVEGSRPSIRFPCLSGLKQGFLPKAGFKISGTDFD